MALYKDWPERGSKEWRVGHEMQIVQRGLYAAKQVLKSTHGVHLRTEEAIDLNAARRAEAGEQRRELHARNHELMRMNPWAPLVEAEAAHEAMLQDQRAVAIEHAIDQVIDNSRLDSRH